jgi:electron transfer flavoprotein-quinone oxidoreductase
VEYSAHIIPEGAWHSMPTLYMSGMLLAGDAAQMINPSHREGSNLAMAAGRMAGETVAEAKKAGNFSSRALALYRTKLENSFVFKDMEDHKDVEVKVRQNRDMLTVYPRLANAAAHEYFLSDGVPKREHQKHIIKKVLRERGIVKMLKDAFILRKMIGE